jgi:hypothetical protein
MSPNGTYRADSMKVKNSEDANALTHCGGAQTEIDKILDQGKVGDDTDPDIGPFACPWADLRPVRLSGCRARCATTIRCEAALSSTGLWRTGSQCRAREAARNVSVLHPCGCCRSGAGGR